MKRLNAPQHAGFAGFVCPADELHAVIKRETPRLIIRAEDKMTTNDVDGTYILANWMHTFLPDVKLGSIPRRIYDIKKGVSTSTKAHFADALTLALDTTLNDENIPTFPGGSKTAIEMVETHLELKGESMDELEIRRLAKKLQRFGMGYLYWDAEIVDVEEEEDQEAAA